ncbi:MAG: hypothetical protein NVSMB43_09110 [Pseudarthrobacter sp.]
MDGTHQFWLQDEVHEIYTGWRARFTAYNLPGTTVAGRVPVRRIITPFANH